jgi:hypothetical protein
MSFFKNLLRQSNQSNFSIFVEPDSTSFIKEDQTFDWIYYYIISPIHKALSLEQETNSECSE